MGDGVGLGDGEGDGLGELVGVGLATGELVGVGLATGEVVGVGLADGETVGVGGAGGAGGFAQAFVSSTLYPVFTPPLATLQPMPLHILAHAFRQEMFVKQLGLG